jgi:hypothetical protein
MSGDRPRPSFDEGAAQAELERLQRDLEESRRRRKDASEAFDKFVGSFKREPARTDAPPSREPQVRVPTRTLSAAGSFPDFPAAKRRAIPAPVIVAGAVVAIAAGVVVTRSWRSTTTEPAAPARVSSSPSADATAPALPVASTAGANEPVTPEFELAAVRRVWIRATVDGARVAERELAPGEKVLVWSGRALVVRAGDAGALRVSVKGQDRGVVGEDGIAVTRTFNAASGGAGR